MAMAGARFATSALAALQGEEQVVECAYIQSDVTSSPYFSTPLVLDVSIAERITSQLSRFVCCKIRLEKP